MSGKASAASGTPILIGFANEQGGAPAFPEANVSAQQTVNFINSQADGIDGHPIKLDPCDIESEEDGQRCGVQFVNAGVKLVVTGQLTVGADTLYAALHQKIPVVVSNPGLPADLTAPDVTGWTSGGLGPAATGIFVTKDLHAKKAAVVYSNDPVGQFVAEKLLKPALIKGGATAILVPLSSTPTAPEVASALSASGASTANAILPVVVAAPCIALAQALVQLGITAPVVSEEGCQNQSVRAGLGGHPPNGWYFRDGGYSPNIPNLNAGTDTYINLMKGPDGKPIAVTYNQQAVFTYGGVMLAARVFNKVGAGATGTGLGKAFRSYTGPVPLVGPPVKCGLITSAPNVCAYSNGFAQYKNGTWMPSLQGPKAINLAPPGG